MCNCKSVLKMLQKVGITADYSLVEINLIIFPHHSADCIINVDLEAADQCQYWLEGIILVSFIILLQTGLVHSHWWRHCALIGWIMMLLSTALLCHKDTAQDTQSLLLGIFLTFRCVFMG